MNELEELKKEIYKKVMDYDEGCNEGKYRFLEELGIESPKKRIVVTIDTTGPQESANEFRNDLESSLVEELAYDYQIDLVECSAVFAEDANEEVGISYNLAKTARGKYVHIKRSSTGSWTYCGISALVTVPLRQFLDNEMSLCSNCHYNSPSNESPGLR